MSRAGNVDVVTVRPTNNIYTVLALIALVVTIAAFLTLYVRASTILRHLQIATERSRSAAPRTTMKSFEYHQGGVTVKLSALTGELRPVSSSTAMASKR